MLLFAVSEAFVQQIMRPYRVGIELSPMGEYPKMHSVMNSRSFGRFQMPQTSAMEHHEDRRTRIVSTAVDSEESSANLPPSTHQFEN